MDRVEQLIAKAEIHDRLCCYARALDRRDYDALRDVFHEDAVDYHGEFVGNVEEFIAWVSKRHADVPFSMHFLGNSLVEFLSDRVAAVETYFIAFQRRASPADEEAGEGVDHQVFGRYVDRFEMREDSSWRIALRHVVYDSTATMPSSHHLRQLVGALGRRDRSDQVFANRSTAAE
jgi:3-phenylpropionate/cinnamic acid dioxygenase small subunit